MNSYNTFLKQNYDNAILLSDRFKKTRLIYWTPLDILNELAIQIGHVFNITNTDCSEVGRNINNLGDELSDVLLQLVALAHSLNIDLKSNYQIELFLSNNINDLIVLYGQLVEATMEISNKRFYKKRKGFSNHQKFITSLIEKMIIITINIADLNNLDINKEFNDMFIDASNFLKKFKKKTNDTDEYVDIYDKNEEYLGIYNKKLVHQSNYFVKTVNCLYINPIKRTVYFQVKNPKHNNAFEQDYCEFTTGGHIKANESVELSICRETKEETGVNINKNKLHFYKKRRKILKLNNYNINEFQYFFLYTDNINLKQLIPNKKESKYFVEIKIKNLLLLLTKPKKKISGNITINSSIRKVSLNIDNFNTKLFLEDNIVRDLLKEAYLKYCEDKISLLRYNTKLKRSIREFNKLLMLKNDYEMEDNIKIMKHKDVDNDNLVYYVLLRKEEDKYSAYSLVKRNDKIISKYIFYKDFKDYKKCLSHYYKIIDIVSNNDNYKIFNSCILSIKIPRKNIKKP